MHPTVAALFDLLFIYFIHFKSETLSVNAAAPDWNIFTSCRRSFSLISLTVSFVFWACFLSLILFACPRVNGKAFDINAKTRGLHVSPLLFDSLLCFRGTVSLLECTVCYSANFCESSVIFTLWSHSLFSVLFVLEEKAHCRNISFTW